MSHSHLHTEHSDQISDCFHRERYTLFTFKALKQQEKNLVNQYPRVLKFACAFIVRFASSETNGVSYVIKLDI